VEKADAQTNVQVVDGAAAVGDRAKAVGKGGILVEGNVSGDVIGAGATKKAEKKNNAWLLDSDLPAELEALYKAIQAPEPQRFVPSAGDIGPLPLINS
jgi:hypothetical protein